MSRRKQTKIVWLLFRPTDRNADSLPSLHLSELKINDYKMTVLVAAVRKN